MIVLVLRSVITAALSRQLIDELKAWTPRMVRKLVSFAVRRLPEEQQERYREEWPSHVADIPGEVWKIFAALGFSIAAIKMRSEARRVARREALSKESRSRALVMMALFVGLVLGENRKVRRYCLQFLLGMVILVGRTSAWLCSPPQYQTAPLTFDEWVACALAFFAGWSLGNKSTTIAKLVSGLPPSKP
jgi:hypothetical protein